MCHKRVDGKMVMKIITKQFEDVFFLLLDTFRFRISPRIVIKNLDWYVSVGFEEAYQVVEGITPETMIGSLIEDDWPYVQTIVSGEDVLSSVAFEQIGSILQVIGDALNSPELYLNPEDTKCEVAIDFVVFYKMSCLVVNAIKAIHPLEINYGDIDKYWAVVSYPEERYGLSGSSPKIELRSLSEDWRRLELVLSGKSDAAPTDFELVGRFVKAFFR